MYNLEKSRSRSPSSVLARGCSSTQPEATVKRCYFKYCFLITVTENHKSQNLGCGWDLRKFQPAVSRNSHLDSQCTSHRSLKAFFSVSRAQPQIRNLEHLTCKHVSIHKHHQLWEMSICSCPSMVTSFLLQDIIYYDNRSCLLSHWIPTVLLYTTLTWTGEI